MQGAEMIRNPDKDPLVRIAAATERLLDGEIGAHSSVALLDFPSHMNVGDSMIWAGEIESIHRIGRRIDYAADHARYDPLSLRKALPQGPILLHGGGNFGDLWPAFQAFRERVVQDFPERKIIQLPQSVHYRDKASATSGNALFAAHQDFLLMCRDSQSKSVCEMLLPDVRTEMVPDAAFGWTAPAERRSEKQSTTVLLRQDHEARHDARVLLEWCQSHLNPETTRYVDWGLRGIDVARWRAARIPGSLVRRIRPIGRLPGVPRALQVGYDSMLQLNLRAGISLFEESSLLITDRLHAHVLAVKMNINHIVLDNSYGKIRAVGSAGSLASEFAQYAANAQEAIDLLIRQSGSTP